MGVDRTRDRTRPKQHVRACRVAPFDRERGRDIDHDVDIGAKAGELRPAIVLRKRRLTQVRCDHVERLVELLQGNGLRLAAIAQTRALGAGHVERVGDAAEASRRVERPVPPVLARIGERDQVPGEIAAVDRGNVPRLQGTKVSRIVPVEQVTAQALHAAHGCERRLQAIDRLARSDPAELTRASDREQIEPDIGRRGSVRDRGRGIVLEIVGRKRIVGGGDESFEEAPGAARGPSQRLSVRVGHRQPRGGGGRQADKTRHGGRSEPQCGEGKRDRPGSVPRRERDKDRNRAKDDRSRHSASETHQVEAPAHRRLRGRSPFEQVAAADAKAPERASDRVGHESSLIRKERYGERRKRHGEARVAAERAHVARHRHARATRRDGGKDRNERRQRDRQHDEQRPDQRQMKRQGPADEQRQHRGGRRERAAQIVQHFPTADCRKDARRRRGAGQRRPTHENPGQQLPVAAGPSVMANGPDVVPRREFLDDLHIRGEPGAREHALEEIVTEQGRVGRAVGKGGLECVDVVDALSGVGSLPEQILIHVGHGRGVGVDSAHAREDPLKERAFAAGRQ